MRSLLSCALTLTCACGSARGGDDAGVDAGPALDAGDAALPDGAADGGDAGPCTVLCGATAAPSPATGAASFAPPGCGGAGSFRLAWTYEMRGIDAAKSYPIVTDVTGDGLPDLVSNPRKLASAVVFPGVAGGTFSNSPTFLPGASAFAGGWGADVGDFDGDGAPDVLAGDHNGGAIAWRNLGGTWTLATGGLPAGTFSGAGLGDLNGDGTLDGVFGADQFGDGFAAVFGNGTGGWTTASAPGIPGYGTGSGVQNAGYFAFADAEGDGDLDVFAFGQNSGSVSAFVYLNDGAGGSFTAAGAFGRGGSGSVGNPVQGGVGDLDCDGIADLAAGGVVFLGNGTSFTMAASVDDANVAHLGDLNGDGLLDLVTHSPTGGVRSYLNDGSGTGFTQTFLALPDHVYVPAGLGTTGVTPLASAYGMDLADVDGDGDLDLVRSFQARVTMGFSSTDHNYFELWLRD